MATVIALPSPPISALFSVRATASLRVPQNNSNHNNENKQKQKKKPGAFGNFSHFAHVVRKDVEFVKRGIDSGVAWATEAFRIPQVAKRIDDLLWLRDLEDPLAPPYSAPSWPQPWYSGTKGRGKMILLHVGCAYICLIRCGSGFSEMGIACFCGWCKWVELKMA